MTYSDKDRAGVEFLVDHRGVDAGRLILIYRSARRHYGGNIEALDATFNVVLREHFGLPPFGP